MNTNTELFATPETIQVEVEVEFEYVMTKAEKRELQKAKEKAAKEAAAEKAAIKLAAKELAAKAAETAAIELAAKELAAKEAAETAAIELAAKELAAKEASEIAAIELAAKELADKETAETAAIELAAKELADKAVEKAAIELDVKVTKTIALLEFYTSKFQSVIESEEKFMKIPPASDFSEFGGPSTFNTTLASLNKVMITKMVEFFQTTILSGTHSLLIVISPEGRDPLEFRASKVKIDPDASNCIHFVLAEKSLTEVTKTEVTKTAVTKTVKNAWPSKGDVDEALGKAEPHKDGLTPSVVYTVTATVDELDAQCENVYRRKYCLTKDQPTDTSKVRFRLFKENKSTWKSMKAVGEKRKESTGGRKKNHA